LGCRDEKWAIEPVGAPDEFGLTKDSRPSQKRVWDRQEVFLAAFAQCGKPVVAARRCGISYWTHCHWEKHDVFGYWERLKVAHDMYCQGVIEQDIDDTLEDKKFNHDILRIFRAKAEMPGKYGDRVQVVGVEPVTQMLDKLPEIAARRLQQEQQLEQGAVEGEYRDLEDKGQG
jgi:hypothetical protein